MAAGPTTEMETEAVFPPLAGFFQADAGMARRVALARVTNGVGKNEGNFPFDRQVDLGFFSSGRNLAAQCFCEAFRWSLHPSSFCPGTRAVVVQGQKGSADAIFQLSEGSFKVKSQSETVGRESGIDDVVDHVWILDDVGFRNASRGRFASIGNHHNGGFPRLRSRPGYR